MGAPALRVIVSRLFASIIAEMTLAMPARPIVSPLLKPSIVPLTEPGSLRVSRSEVPAKRIVCPAATPPPMAHAAPASSTIDPKLVKLLPNPFSVPVVAADASSSVLAALALPMTAPVNSAPGSATTRLLPVSANSTAVPPLPMMVPAFTSVPPAAALSQNWTPTPRAVIEHDRALVIAPPPIMKTPPALP